MIFQHDETCEPAPESGDSGDSIDEGDQTSGMLTLERVKSSADCEAKNSPSDFEVRFIYDANACACLFTFTEGTLECEDNLVFNIAHKAYENSFCITEAERDSLLHTNEVCEPDPESEDGGETDGTVTIERVKNAAACAELH